ncbi:30S ribosomal protein S6 [Reyranella sp. CPCC 100927]|uniref:30S ribosomal protein S6 n=1 Tax=Reyranella sp. CPCC 100927 TaxID=2599616 RepID=UPI0011B3D0F2|nr:30S ribosomal protein S6 [Reyranella sp. CPCC 100927]TWT10309.1 30S ribosomal protein S6 [Reyranella sp. CPCC 100927]
MPLYETVFVVRQDVAQTQVEALGTQFSDLIATMGGQVPKKEYWGLRQLAYRMKKNRKAHYMLMNIESPPDAVKEMERTMSINEDVLRYLTIRVDELEAGPSAMMRKSDRDDRGDRGERRRDREPRGDRGDRGERPRFAREGGGAPAGEAEGGEGEAT